MPTFYSLSTCSGFSFELLDFEDFCGYDGFEDFWGFYFGFGFYLCDFYDYFGLVVFVLDCLYSLKSEFLTSPIPSCLYSLWPSISAFSLNYIPTLTPEYSSAQLYKISSRITTNALLRSSTLIFLWFLNEKFVFNNWLVILVKILIESAIAKFNCCFFLVLSYSQ